MKYSNILKARKEIELYIDHNRKIIDLCGSFYLQPYPPHIIKEGVCEERCIYYLNELFHYKYQ